MLCTSAHCWLASLGGLFRPVVTVRPTMQTSAPVVPAAARGFREPARASQRVVLQAAVRRDRRALPARAELPAVASVRQGPMPARLEPAARAALAAAVRAVCLPS